MRDSTHKRETSGSGVIILEENLVQIGVIIADTLLFTKRGLDLYFQGQARPADMTLLLSVPVVPFW